MEECNLALAEELEDREEELEKMVLHDRVAAIVWMRLEMQIPYLSKWAQALSIQVLPFPLLSRQKKYLFYHQMSTLGPIVRSVPSFYICVYYTSSEGNLTVDNP